MLAPEDASTHSMLAQEDASKHLMRTRTEGGQHLVAAFLKETEHTRLLLTARRAHVYGAGKALVQLARIPGLGFDAVLS